MTWTFWNGDTAGALAHLPAALIGLAVVDAGVLLVARRLRRRSAEEAAGRTIPPSPRRG